MSDFQEFIGFDNQGSMVGNCAQRCLVHSLLLLGIPISVDTAHSKTGVSRFSATIRGTTKESLLKGIRRCGCFAFEYESTRADDARKKIEAYLKLDMPVIINIDSYSVPHWIVLAGTESAKTYYWIDSNEPELYGYESWSEIAGWMKALGSYYMIGVKPEDEDQLKHSLVGHFSEAYELFDDDDLAESWGVYLEDLSEMFDSPNDGRPVITPDEFFSRHSEKLVESVSYYNGIVTKNDVRYELKNHCSVAKAHRMTLSRERETEALVALTVAVAYGV